jgi:hypothetical protein
VESCFSINERTLDNGKYIFFAVRARAITRQPGQSPVRQQSTVMDTERDRPKIDYSVNYRPLVREGSPLRIKNISDQ